MAARRLGGSMVQRAEAAVAGGRRRLGPRLMHTEEQAHGEIAREVQQKIDGLYDLIAKGENNVKTSSWGDAFLLLPLAKRVTPRPGDSDWCDLQKGRIVLNKIKRAGLVSLTFVAADYYSRYSNDKEAPP